MARADINQFSLHQEPGNAARCGKINATCRANAGYGVPVVHRPSTIYSRLDLSPLIPNEMEIEPFYFFSIPLPSFHRFDLSIYIYI